MITALLVLAIAAVIGFGVALAVRAKHEFAVQNEVVPGRRSPAPASWAGAHSREAKMHRRLGDAVRSVHTNARLTELGLASQIDAIDAQAVAIDERLVVAAALAPPHRDAALDALERLVADVEATIAELTAMTAVAASPTQLDEAVSAADIRLRALAEARAEVEMIDRRTFEQAVGEPSHHETAHDTDHDTAHDTDHDTGHEGTGTDLPGS